LDLNDSRAIYFVDDRTVVLGDRAGVRHFVRTYTANPASALAPAYNAALVHKAVFALNFNHEMPTGAKKDRLPTIAYLAMDEATEGPKKDFALTMRLQFLSVAAATAEKKAQEAEFAKAVKNPQYKLVPGSASIETNGPISNWILQAGADQ